MLGVEGIFFPLLITVIIVHAFSYQDGTSLEVNMLYKRSRPRLYNCSRKKKEDKKGKKFGLLSIWYLTVSLCSTDTSSMKPCCVRNVSDTRVGHRCHVYF